MIFMLGYSQKDRGLAHCRAWHKNMFKKDLRDGRRAYDTVAILPTDDRDIIYMTNITKLMFAFWTLQLKPLRVPLRYLLFWMIQSGKYAVTLKWASLTPRHDMSQAVLMALWVTYIAPQEVTIKDVHVLFFNTERDRNK